MKQELNKPAYAASLIVFLLSFGYFWLDALWVLLKYSLRFSFYPDSDSTGFTNGAFAKLLDTIFLEETAVLPMLLFFALSLLLPVLVFVFLRKSFKRKSLILIASAPIVLLLVYGILQLTGMLMEHFHIHFAYSGAENVIVSAVSFVLLTAYAVGFLLVMCRERKRFKAHSS